jgi:hypothetical protein
MDFKEARKVIESHGAVISLNHREIDTAFFIDIANHEKLTTYGEAILRTLIFNPLAAVKVFSSLLYECKGDIKNKRITGFIGRFVRFRKTYGSLMNMAISILQDLPTIKGEIDCEIITWIREEILFIALVYKNFFASVGGDEEIRAIDAIISELRRVYLTKVDIPWCLDNITFGPSEDGPSESMEDIASEDENGSESESVKGVDLVKEIERLVTINASDDHEDMQAVYKGVTDAFLRNDSFEIVKDIIQNFDTKDDTKIYDFVLQYVKGIVIEKIVRPIRIIHGEGLREIAVKRAIDFFTVYR